MDIVKFNSRNAGKQRYGFDPLELRTFKKYDKVYRERATQRYDEVIGKPKDGEDYDYAILNNFAKVEKASGTLP